MHAFYFFNSFSYCTNNMKIVTIYNIKKNDPGVLFALFRYGNLVWSINVLFVTVVLCQINSLSQKKDHFNKPQLFLQN